MFCGVEPRDAVGHCRRVLDLERSEILKHCRLLSESNTDYHTNVMEIHRINDKIYSITYSTDSEPYVEELLPFGD
jgi:hypothetical protein